MEDHKTPQSLADDNLDAIAAAGQRHRPLPPQPDPNPTPMPPDYQDGGDLLGPPDQQP